MRLGHWFTQTFALEQDVVQFPACKASGWPPLVLIRRCCGNPVAQVNSSQNASVLGTTSWKVTLPEDASSAPPSAACLPPEHAPAITAATTNEPVRIECHRGGNARAARKALTRPSDVFYSVKFLMVGWAACRTLVAVSSGRFIAGKIARQAGGQFNDGALARHGGNSGPLRDAPSQRRREPGPSSRQPGPHERRLAARRGVDASVTLHPPTPDLFVPLTLGREHADAISYRPRIDVCVT
jgi:hypothetical protein